MGSPIAFQEIFKAGMEDFVVPSYETAPFTTIQNRAKVTRSLKAVAGVERIPVKGLNLIQNEFGPNGGRVFEADSKDARVRFVGSGWQSQSSVHGVVQFSTTLEDFAEITFYGTGLNLMSYINSQTGDYRSTVDAGSESGNLYTVNANVLVSRNYAVNIIKPIATGLTADWHTIRLRVGAAGTVNGLSIYGFEVLNERTNLAVYSGQGVANGASQGLNALATSAFNTGVVGTRGARVVKYIQGGVVSQAVQEVDAASKYLTLTDHANEEVVRRINWKEFGANRADDFSTLTNTQSNRSFTLEDGTTTLAALGVETTTSISGLRMSTSGAFIILTFTGSGIDMTAEQDSTSTALLADAILIDGVSIGLQNVFPIDTTGTSVKLYKLASGLPYGTHTLRIQRSSGTNNFFRPVDFLIYQPKKPAIPAGAFEVADYNVMADFVTRSAGSVGSISTGVLRKMFTREVAYVGTWTVAAQDSTSFESGFNIRTQTSGSYYEYTFWGTGFDLKSFFDSGRAINATISVNGSSNLSAFTTGLVAVSTGLTLTAATGVLSGTTVGGGGVVVQVRNLPLGRHTVRYTTNNTAENYAGCIDVITPIHSQESTLKIGSTSLRSVTKYSPEKSISNTGPDMSKAKAWVVYDYTTQRILASHNVSAVLRVTTGNCIVYFEKAFKTENYAIAFAQEATSSDLNLNYKAAYCEFFTRNAGTPIDDPRFSVIFFGELIDE